MIMLPRSCRFDYKPIAGRPPVARQGIPAAYHLSNIRHSSVTRAGGAIHGQLLPEGELQGMVTWQRLEELVVARSFKDAPRASTASPVPPEALPSPFGPLGPRPKPPELPADYFQRPGITIEPPEFVVEHSPLALPPLPLRDPYASHVELHVFWDTWAAHPRAADPRTLTARLARLAGAYGRVAGVYAYCTRKSLNWVPDALLRRYAPDRLRADVVPGPGGVRCPVCGARKPNAGALSRHMAQLHGGTPRARPETPPSAQALASGRGRAKGPPGASLRTLGRVLLYHDSSGRPTTPPPGHQISLKYVLQQEGAQVRVVSRGETAEAVNLSVARGVRRLLRRLAAAGGPPPGVQVAVVLVTDDVAPHVDAARRHAEPLTAALAACRRQRVNTLAVCAGPRQRLGADVVLRWNALAAGAYDAAMQAVAAPTTTTSAAASDE